ncbi:hypothetical protein NQZ79_g6339 [Umbelopsis isabellina]|nr:hypothetical protein NQZ79_g6339 [Umbelopsis isabellina]
MPQAIANDAILYGALLLLLYNVFHSFDIKTCSTVLSALFIVFSLSPTIMQQFQVLASPDVKSIKEQPPHSLETHCKNLELDPLPDNTEHIPQESIFEYTNNVDNNNTPTPIEELTSKLEPSALSDEPESMDVDMSPSPVPLSQRRQAQDLRVLTDSKMVPPSPSLSTPLRNYRMPSSLRGSFSETTSARSPTTVIPPDFSLKRPAGRRHSTITIAAQRLEADARRKELLANKPPGSAIDKRAFGFEPIFGEWERRAKADKSFHTSPRTLN